MSVNRSVRPSISLRDKSRTIRRRIMKVYPFILLIFSAAYCVQRVPVRMLNEHMQSTLAPFSLPNKLSWRPWAIRKHWCCFVQFLGFIRWKWTKQDTSGLMDKSGVPAINMLYFWTGNFRGTDVTKIRRIMWYLTKNRSLVWYLIFGHGCLLNLPHFSFVQ